MAKNKLGTSLISTELRDLYVAEVKLIFKTLQESSLNPVLLEQAPKALRKKLEAFRDQLPKLEAQLLIELRDKQVVACTVDEAELAIGTARRLHRDFIMMMQPNLNDRKKIVRDFYKFARDQRFSRWTKTLFAGGWGTAIGFVAGALLFILAFHVAVGISLGVAAGIGVLAGIIAAAITYRRAKNPHEDSERGKKERDCLNAIVSSNGNDLELYITLRSQHIAAHAPAPAATRSIFPFPSMRGSADPRPSLKKTDATEVKPTKSSKSSLLGMFKRSKSDNEQEQYVGKENDMPPIPVQSAKAANRRAAYARAKTATDPRTLRPRFGGSREE